MTPARAVRMEEFRTGRTIGPYRVTRLLGRGGMGVVYEAESASGERVALKVFAAGGKNREFLEKRFRAEAKLLVALDHPHLVKVHDLGVDAATGAPWFAMDLVLNASGEPETLEDARRRGGISQEQALGWFRDLFDELVHLHSHGVVHRDVKLENVLIDASGHAVLSDFGISRIFDDGLRSELGVTTTFVEGQTSGTRPVMGTYFYLAPEVRAGRAVTPAADWYALGVLFFRLLTGMWYEPPAARAETDAPARASPFDLLLMFDSFWRTNLPRLLSDDQKTRTVVVAVHGAKRPRWMLWLGLGFLAAGALIAARTGCAPYRGAESGRAVAPRPPPNRPSGRAVAPRPPPNRPSGRAVAPRPPFHDGVLRMAGSESLRGVDLGAVTSLVVEAAMRNVPPNRFRSMPALRHVMVEEGVESVGVSAFFGCTNLESVVLPDSLKHICGYAFGDCFALKEVRIGKGLLDVGQAAFGGCSNLQHVHFGGDAPSALGTRIYVRTPTNLVNHVQPAAKGWGRVWPPNDVSARRTNRMIGRVGD